MNNHFWYILAFIVFIGAQHEMIKEVHGIHDDLKQIKRDVAELSTITLSSNRDSNRHFENVEYLIRKDNEK